MGIEIASSSAQKHGTPAHYFWGQQVGRQGARYPLMLGPVPAKPPFNDSSKKTIGVTSPFFPGILLSKKPPNTLGKLVLKGIHHCWKYVHFFPGDLSKWRRRIWRHAHLCEPCCYAARLRTTGAACGSRNGG